MAVLATASLLLFFFLSVRVNAAEQVDDDDTAYQPTKNDVTRSPSVKNYDVDGVKAKFLNVLERKLKTFPHQKPEVGGVGKAPQSAAPIEAVKRRSWAENSMSAWGKRRSQALQLAVPRFKRSAPYTSRRMSANPTGGDWGDEASLGKGRVNPSEFSDEDIGEDAPMDHPGRGRLSQLKRRWSDHSMNAWGKRLQTGNPMDLSGGDDEGASDPQPPSSPPLPPKGRSSNQIYFFLLPQHHHRNGISKRNWATNTMDVWGKRSTPQNRGDSSPGYETHLNTVSLYSN